MRSFGLKRRTALQTAARGGYEALVERLLEAGADVNDSALRFATHVGQPTVVAMLRRAGALGG